MSWLASIGVGLVSACLCAMALGAAAGWAGVLLDDKGPDAATGAAFAIFLATLLGAPVGFVAGLGLSRVMSVSQLVRVGGVALAALVAVCVASGAAKYALEDREPMVDGKTLAIDYELRAPRGYAWPPANSDSPQARLVTKKAFVSRAELHFHTAEQVDGRWVLRGTLPLASRREDKMLAFYFRQYEAAQAIFWPGMTTPRRQDFAWSGWLDSARTAGQPKLAPEENFNLRFKVSFR